MADFLSIVDGNRQRRDQDQGINPGSPPESIGGEAIDDGDQDHPGGNREEAQGDVAIAGGLFPKAERGEVERWMAIRRDDADDLSRIAGCPDAPAFVRPDWIAARAENPQRCCEDQQRHNDFEMLQTIRSHFNGIDRNTGGSAAQLAARNK